MFQVNINFDSSTRILSDASGSDDYTIATMGDNDTTKLVFNITDSGNLLEGYASRVEFDVWIHSSDNTVYKPYILLDENNSAVIPNYILANAKRSVLPIQLAFGDDNGNELYSFNKLQYTVRNSVNASGTQEEAVPEVMQAYVSIAYDSDTFTLTFTRLNGSTTEIQLSELFGPMLVDVSSSIDTESSENPIVLTLYRNDGNTEDVGLPVPYLSDGKIPGKFFDHTLVVDLYKIQSVSNLTDGTCSSAVPPDFALVNSTTLYMCVGNDPSQSSSWYQVNYPLISEWQSTPDNVHIPSEKLVKDSLDAEALARSNADTSLDNAKLDKVTSSNAYVRLYGVNALGGQAMYNLDTGKNGGTVAWRDAQGHLVAEDPSVAGHVATKNYVDNGLSGKAPTNHASSETTYGVGSSSQYGHVMVDNAMSDSSTNPVQNCVVRDFVNSSIATSTANFLGTYDAITDLGFTQVQVDAWGNEPTAQQEADISTAIGNLTLPSAPTNNDYLFISVNRSTTIDVDSYWKFKYTIATTPASWKFEYPLNNSSFTQAQWDTLNSLLTNSGSVGIDVQDIIAHIGDSKIHIPAETTAGKVLTSNSDGQASWKNVTANNPSLSWGTESTIGTVGDTTFKVTMPANPDTDTKVSQSLLSDNYNLPLLLSQYQTNDSTVNRTGGSYRNNSIYANPSTGSIYASKVYSNNSEVMNLADAQEITGVKTFSGVNGLVIQYDGRGGRYATTIKNTTLEKNVNPTSTNYPYYINIKDKNGVSLNDPIGVQISANQSSGIIQFSAPRMDGTNTKDLSVYAGYSTALYRTYDASHTNDIVTIGSLQESTDVVHTSGNETIGGGKTFTNTPTITSHALVLKNDTYAKSLSTTTYTNFADIIINDKNDAVLSQIRTDHLQDDSRRVFLLLERTMNSTNYRNRLSLVINSSGDSYVTLPHRSYASAGNDDVLVKAQLESAITIGGAKTFTSTATFKGTSGAWAMQLDASTVKLTDTITAWTRLNQIQFRDASDTPLSSGYIQNDMRLINDVKVTEVAIGATNSNGTQSTMFVRVDANNNIWATAPTRTYDANNTSDIVTIGSLQASTDVVHRTGNEAIDGTKTFNDSIIATGNNMYGFQRVNSSLPSSRGSFVTSGYYDNAIATLTNSNSSQFTQFSEVDQPNSREIRFRMWSPTANGWRGLSIMDNGQVYTTAPYRTSNITNDDVLTAGNGVTLSTSQTITGLKTTKVSGSDIVTFQSQSDTLDQSVTGVTGRMRYRWCDKNGTGADNRLIEMSVYRRTNGDNSLYLTQFNKVNNALTSVGLNITLETNGTAHMEAPYRTYGSINVNDVVTIGSLQQSTDVVHTAGNETIGGKKTLTNGLLGLHNETAIPATEQNRWLGIQYTGLTTQFLKFYFVDYINNTSSRLIEGCMFWNGSKANARVYVKVIGPAFLDPTASMKVTIDTDNKFTVWLKCNYYHSVMRNVEMGRSWTDNITPTFVQIDSPDWTTFDTVKEVEIQ